MLVTNLTNIRYLTGLDLSAGILLVLPGEYRLYVDDRYMQQAMKNPIRRVKVLPAKQAASDSAKLKRCGIESETVTIADFLSWKRKYKNTKFIQTSDVIEEFRRAKAPQELRSIRSACAMTRTILRAIPALLRSGTAEQDVAWKLAEHAHRLGAAGMAFETIVGFGEHTARPHHRPTDRRLRKGDLVQIDMGVVVNGYRSDYSRVYFTAAPSQEQATVYKQLARVQKTMMKRVKAGRTNRELDAEARAMLKKYGYDQEFCHALGHGVGLDIHEGLVLSARAPERTLLPGEVITIEPGLYFAGKWGMRIEDTVIVG